MANVNIKRKEALKLDDGKFFTKKEDNKYHVYGKESDYCYGKFEDLDDAKTEIKTLKEIKLTESKNPDAMVEYLYESLTNNGVNGITAIRGIAEKLNVDVEDVMQIVEGKSFKQNDKYADDEDDRKGKYQTRDKARKSKMKDQNNDKNDDDDLKEGKSFRHDDNEDNKGGSKDKRFTERMANRKDKKADQDKLDEDFGDGHSEGYSQGYSEGYRDGYYEAIEEVKELLSNLQLQTE
jgi:hypothetical protein